MDARSMSPTSYGKKSVRQKMIPGKDSHMPHTSCISLKKLVESLSGRMWSIQCSVSQGFHLQEHLTVLHLPIHLLHWLQVLHWLQGTLEDHLTLEDRLMFHLLA